MSNVQQSRPTCQKVSSPCVKYGQPAAREMRFVWQAGDDELLHVLYVFSDWGARRGDWAQKDGYAVEEIPSPLGRAFLLHRDQKAIAKDPDEERYGVLSANQQDTQCECKGFQARGYCNHVAAVRRALENCHLNRQPAPVPRRHLRPSVSADATILEVLPDEDVAWTFYGRHKPTGHRLVVATTAEDGDRATVIYREILSETHAIGGPDAAIPFELSNNRPDPVACPF